MHNGKSILHPSTTIRPNKKQFSNFRMERVTDISFTSTKPSLQLIHRHRTFLLLLNPFYHSSHILHITYGINGEISQEIGYQINREILMWIVFMEWIFNLFWTLVCLGIVYVCVCACVYWMLMMVIRVGSLFHVFFWLIYSDAEQNALYSIGYIDWRDENWTKPENPKNLYAGYSLKMYAIHVYNKPSSCFASTSISIKFI